jgi:hypothetical protein
MHIGIWRRLWRSRAGRADETADQPTVKVDVATGGRLFEKQTGVFDVTKPT